MKTVVAIPSLQQPADGIISTLGYLDHSLESLRVFSWDPKVKPAFDMFDELGPDLLIGDAQNIPDIHKCMSEFNTKLVVCGGMPPHSLTPDLLLFTGEVPEMIQKHSPFPYLGFSGAANLSKFRNGKFDEDKECDILYFACQPNPHPAEADILSLMAGMTHSFKVIGYRRPLLNYVGQTSLQETADFFASAKVCVDIDGMQKYDVAAQKGFCITNQVGLYPNISSFGVEEWTKNVEDYIRHDDKRKSHAEIAHKKIMAGNTYFHRLSQVFNKIDWENEAEKTLEIYSQVVSND